MWPSEALGEPSCNCICFIYGLHGLHPFPMPVNKKSMLEKRAQSYLRRVGIKFKSQK
jgi:hypothetical protein